MTAKTRFGIGRDVEFFKPNDKAWEAGQVVKEDPKGQGYEVKAKDGLTSEVPHLFVREPVEVRGRPFPDVVSVLDPVTQTVLRFPLIGFTYDIWSGMHEAEFSISCIDAPSGRVLLGVSAFLSIGFTDHMPVVSVNMSWSSITPSSDPAEAQEFQRNLGCHTRASVIVFALAAGIGQILRSGETLEKAMAEVHRRAGLEAARTLDEALAAFTAPPTQMILTTPQELEDTLKRLRYN